MKKVILIVVLLLILVAGVFFGQNYLRSKNLIPFVQNDPTATINGHTFELNVADSNEEKEIGLSKTNSLSDNQGMIFLFEKPDYYSFWMKNMKIPIDIIYINKDIIVTILQNVPLPASPTESPIVYTPSAPSDKVLEIKAGLSEKYSFKEGDKITIENL